MPRRSRASRGSFWTGLALALCALGAGHACFTGWVTALRPARTCLRVGPPDQDALGDKLMSFGKHKGKKTFRETAEDKGYTEWCRQNLADKPYAAEFLNYAATASSKATPRQRTAPTRTKPPSGNGHPPGTRVVHASASTARAPRRQETPRTVRPPASVTPPARPRSSAPPLRAATQRAAKAAPLKVKGLNADIFELPRGLLEGYQSWACKGKVEPSEEKNTPWAFGYNDGWTYVGRVKLGYRLVLNLKDPLKPHRDSGSNCNPIDESDLTELEYARFLGALMELEGRNDLSTPREVIHKGKRYEALPRYHFRGILLDGKAHVAPTLDQELYAPEEKTLGGQKRTAMASLVGLKVRPLGPAQPWFTGLVICEPPDKENVTLTPSIKQNLLQMTKTPKVKDATAKALVDELLLTVSKNCTNAKDLKMTFVANALRPSLTGRVQEERLRGLKGWESFQALPPSIMILEAGLRQRMIADEVSRLSSKIFKPSMRPLRVESQHFFQKLRPPNLVINGGKAAISGTERPSKALFQIDRLGAFKVRTQAAPLRLAAASFGAAKHQETFVARVLEDVKKLLETFGLRVADPLPPLHHKGSREEVENALGSEAIARADALLLFGGKMTDAMYNQAKYDCLRSHNDAGKHIANQWFDLGKSNVWSPNSKTLVWAEKICALGIMAKLGHAPWAIDVRPWFRGEPEDIRVGVVGYDVCHLRNPRDFKKPISIAAAIRVDSESDSDPWLLSRITFRTEHVRAETVPSESLEEMIPASFARGRLLIIHRDGEFPKAELESLQRYHGELAASEGGSSTTFVLVECVKWAGGSPRLYDGTKSAQAGVMAALSDKEALLASSKDLFQGTANPIRLRLAGVFGDAAQSNFAMDKFAWVQTVFDLSYLHHGSAMKRPRLPVTTHFADRLAYMLSALGKDGGEWERELTKVSEGTEQFWL